ncbi:cupin domain-containing protein [Brevundimonas sp. VNH65]|uniref:cupin domain-containing protein n=1 Tax=Brevundimonas sp. VNH65 TaxID=3400917 RepID=UPI003C08D528
MLASALAALLLQTTPAQPAPPMVVVREADVRVEQNPPPHNGVGHSTAFRLSDAAPGRNFEFRKRILHPGASIGLHVLTHDEVYYVVSGQGEVASDGRTEVMGPETAAYLYEGADVGIKQVGDEPLVLIIAYPLGRRLP